MFHSDEDLEDGEIADSGEEDGGANKGAVGRQVPEWRQQIVDPAAHRGTRISGIQSSDESCSEEEHESSPCKMKRVRGMSGQSFPAFQNPLLASKSNSDGSRRKNNVWGSVLTEQTLTSVVSSVGVEEKLVDCDRDVESYDYTKAYNDNRTLPSPVRQTPVESESEPDDLEQLESFGAASHTKRRTSVKARLGSRCSVSSGDDSDVSNQSEGGAQWNGRRGNTWRPDVRSKRRRSFSKEQKKQGLILKDRLGTRSYDCHKDRSHIRVTSQDPPEMLVEELLRVLKEPDHQRPLLLELAEVMGTERMLEILYITEDLEQAGGLMTIDGRRRRTAGGVFLALAKEDTVVDHEAVLAIFREHQKQHWKKMKAEKKLHRRNTKQRSDSTEKMETSSSVKEPVNTSPMPDNQNSGLPEVNSESRQLVADDDDLFDYTPDVEIDVF